MSGTSLDGIDGVVVEFATSADTGAPASLRVTAHAHRDFAGELRHELRALNRSGSDEIHRAALAGNALARDYAAPVETLLERAALGRSDIVAIGCHGQTVRHRPGEFDGTGYTVQLNAPALLAELTRHRRDRRFPQPRRRCRRPGRTAGAGVSPRVFGRAGRDDRGAQSRRNRQPHAAAAPTARRRASIAGPATPCSISGASGTAGRSFDAAGRLGRARQGRRAPARASCSPSPTSRWPHPRAPAATCSTPTGSTSRLARAGVAARLADRTCRRRSPS